MNKNARSTLSHSYVSWGFARVSAISLMGGLLFMASADTGWGEEASSQSSSEVSSGPQRLRRLRLEAQEVCTALRSMQETKSSAQRRVVDLRTKINGAQPPASFVGRSGECDTSFCAQMPGLPTYCYNTRPPVGARSGDTAGLGGTSVPPSSNSDPTDSQNQATILHEIRHSLSVYRTAQQDPCLRIRLIPTCFDALSANLRSPVESCWRAQLYSDLVAAQSSIPSDENIREARQRCEELRRSAQAAEQECNGDPDCGAARAAAERGNQPGSQITDWAFIGPALINGVTNLAGIGLNFGLQFHGLNIAADGQQRYFSLANNAQNQWYQLASSQIRQYGQSYNAYADAMRALGRPVSAPNPFGGMMGSAMGPFGSLNFGFGNGQNSGITPGLLPFLNSPFGLNVNPGQGSLSGANQTLPALMNLAMMSPNLLGSVLPSLNGNGGNGNNLLASLLNQGQGANGVNPLLLSALLNQGNAGSNPLLNGANNAGGVDPFLLSNLVKSGALTPIQAAALANGGGTNPSLLNSLLNPAGNALNNLINPALASLLSGNQNGNNANASLLNPQLLANLLNPSGAANNGGGSLDPRILGLLLNQGGVTLSPGNGNNPLFPYGPLNINQNGITPGGVVNPNAAGPTGFTTSYNGAGGSLGPAFQGAPYWNAGAGNNGQWNGMIPSFNQSLQQGLSDYNSAAQRAQQLMAAGNVQEARVALENLRSAYFRLYQIQNNYGLYLASQYSANPWAQISGQGGTNLPWVPWVAVPSASVTVANNNVAIPSTGSSPSGSNVAEPSSSNTPDPLTE